MKINCEIAKDLIPLYVDETLNDESRKAVEEHVSGCKKCQTVLDDMKMELDIPTEPDVEIFKNIRKRFALKYAFRGLIVVVLLAALWMGASIYVMTNVKAVWPKASKEAIDEYVSVEEIDGDLYVRHVDIFASGFVELAYENKDKGEIGVYIAESGIHGIGNNRAWYGSDAYHKIPCSDEVDITKINYCKEDGTVITTLWEK